MSSEASAIRLPSRAALPGWRDLLLLFVACSWGLPFLFTKMGLVGFDTTTFTFLRTASAAIVLNCFALVHARDNDSGPLRLRDHFAAVGLGLLGQAAFPYCFSLAMEATSSTNGGLIFGATPVSEAGQSPDSRTLTRSRPSGYREFYQEDSGTRRESISAARMRHSQLPARPQAM